MARSKTAAAKALALEREQKGLRLRMTGASHAEIGAVLGITEEGARQAVLRAMAKAREVIQETAEEARTLELQRLDALQLGLWPMAVRGNTKAALAVLRVMERRARLLGLDAAIKHAVNWRREAEEKGLPAGELFDQMVGLILDRMKQERRGDA